MHHPHLVTNLLFIEWKPERGRSHRGQGRENAASVRATWPGRSRGQRKNH